MDNEDGSQHYYFLDFVDLSNSWHIDVTPTIIRDLGVCCRGLKSFNPLVAGYSDLSNTLKPKSIEVISENEFLFLFSEEQSNSCHINSFYYTGNIKKWIKKITFVLVGIGSDLQEIIKYSDNTQEINYYHLISRSPLILKPSYYNLFDI